MKLELSESWRAGILPNMLLLAGQYAPTVLSARIKDLPTMEEPLPYYRFVAVTDGSHRLTLPGKTTSLQVDSGSIYLITPGSQLAVSHHHQSTGISIDFTIKSCKLESGQDQELLLADQQIQPKPEAVWGFLLPLIVPEELCSWTLARLRLISGIWWRSDREHFKANMRLNEILEHLSDSLMPSVNKSEPPSGPDWFAAITRACHGRIATIQSVEDLAAIAGMSIAHFSRQFQQEIGTSPGAWLREQRLAATAALLRSSNMAVQDIAMHVGFRRVNALNQAWRKQYDCTPSEWRNGKLGR